MQELLTMKTDKPLERAPHHVAIIMDGNGRWAERRGRPRVFGHIRGSSRVKPIVQTASRLGVQALTLYAFSTENWLRPSQELSVLWKLLIKFLNREEAAMNAENVRLRVIGEVDKLSHEVRQVIDRSVSRLEKNTGLQLTFCISYGSRREILHAANQYAKQCLENGKVPTEISEAEFEKLLWTAPLGDLSEVDLLIRTSGELRISNFLLWQAAYAELYFTEINWPDFEPRHFIEALHSYRQRDRRFGGISPQNEKLIYN